MWGDPQGAASLVQSSPLGGILHRVSGPNRIPLSDPLWTELLQRYDILVHLDRRHDAAEGGGGNDGVGLNGQGEAPDTPGAALSAACRSMAINCRSTSNLAALALHLSRMVGELALAVADLRAEVGGKGAMGRIELVGRARATCGAINLFRILAHAAVVAAAGEGGGSGDGGYLFEAFTYRTTAAAAAAPYPTQPSRRRHRRREAPDGRRDAAGELLDAFLGFLVTLGSSGNRGRDKGDLERRDSENDGALDWDWDWDWSRDRDRDRGGGAKGKSEGGRGILPPEIYDAAVQTFGLLLVLTGAQLYSPMVSSLQRSASRDGDGSDDENYFLRRIMEEAHKYQHEVGGAGGTLGGFVHRQSTLEREGEAPPSWAPPPWSAAAVVRSLLAAQTRRPRAPAGSVSHHHTSLARLVAEHVRGERIGADGMYETHSIVMASSPVLDSRGRPVPIENELGDSHDRPSGAPAESDESALESPFAIQSGSADRTTYIPSSSARGVITVRQTSTRAILDATRGVLHASSAILALPFRLVSLALALFGGADGLGGRRFLLGKKGGRGVAAALAFAGSTGEGGYDHTRMVALEAAFAGGETAAASGAASHLPLVGTAGGSRGKRLTHDVLWLTDSPVADLATAFFLVLANNCRAGSDANPFRAELASLSDGRWEGRKDGTGLDGSIDIFGEGATAQGGKGSAGHGDIKGDHAAISTNFETLFYSFGRTLHTESSQLLLYTLLQASPSFAASIAVRSDLDTLVLPLLRTLYISSTMTHQQMAPTGAVAAEGRNPGNDIQHRPHFRSRSQLYVILILLLILSQDQSFGADIFRRVMVAHAPWYRERHMRDVNLGSVMLLTVLRAISFNLHRIKDPFLLSNCCAVLLNVSPYLSGLHNYAAMRLASVTVSCMKKYTVLVGKNGGRPAEDGDLSSDLGMYGETCHTLLQVVKHGIMARHVDKNLHLIYALTYLQRDFYDIMSARGSPFKAPDVGSIITIISQADKIIQEDGTASSAEQTMAVLESDTSVEKLKAVTKKSPSPGTQRERSNSVDSASSDMSVAGGDFTFTYEEEADPEIFFVPYLWEVIVCTLTASSLEWEKEKIRVFPLLEDALVGDDEAELAPALRNFASDAADAV